MLRLESPSSESRSPGLEAYIKLLADAGFGIGARWTKLCIAARLTGGERYIQLCTGAGPGNGERYIQLCNDVWLKHRDRCIKLCIGDGLGVAEGTFNCLVNLC